MGVDIPQPFVTKIAGPIGPVTVDGVPDNFDIDIDINSLPKIQLGIDPVTLNPVDARITLAPVDVTMRIDRLPDTRTHLPADFVLGVCVLGMELMAVRLRGEAQMITEPYVPGPCERPGRPETGPDLRPLPQREG
ncbi:hypothetical protein [Actinoplanes sp. GCM10030250]|uniref:hypothetical protein n=1 Tax=Actinoplanes sp. GCM10030250 TaxID=3273376 RepID=UPI0036174078